MLAGRAAVLAALLSCTSQSSRPGPARINRAPFAVVPTASGTGTAPCPAVDGVVVASHCAGGFNATNSTLTLRAALASDAHIVRIPNMGSPWRVAPSPGWDEATGYSPCHATPGEGGHCPALYLFNVSGLTLIFEPGATLAAIPGGFHNENAALLRVERCDSLTIVGAAGIRKIMNFAFKIMNFAFKMMDFAYKMMNFAL